MASNTETSRQASNAKDGERCRTCGGPVSGASTSYPFCSPRCRMADLGKWFDEDYRISREIKDSDIETVD